MSSKQKKNPEVEERQPQLSLHFDAQSLRSLAPVYSGAVMAEVMDNLPDELINDARQAVADLIVDYLAEYQGMFVGPKDRMRGRLHAAGRARVVEQLDSAGIISFNWEPDDLLVEALIENIGDGTITARYWP